MGERLLDETSYSFSVSGCTGFIARQFPPHPTEPSTLSVFGITDDIDK
jgi:hypothetical protein